MEKIPGQATSLVGLEAEGIDLAGHGQIGGWRQGLPTLQGRKVALRNLRESDAASLFALLSTDDVSRFISPPPSHLDEFERFVAWTDDQRRSGSSVCFAVTLKGYDTAIGIFQVRQLGLGFDTSEWGFALGSPFWGTGVFSDSAELVLEFAFQTLGVHRLEARAAAANGRGNGALIKIGAVQEALMRKAFWRNGQFEDQILYSIVEDDWRTARSLKAMPAMPAVPEISRKYCSPFTDRASIH